MNGHGLDGDSGIFIVLQRGPGAIDDVRYRPQGNKRMSYPRIFSTQALGWSAALATTVRSIVVNGGSLAAVYADAGCFVSEYKIQ